MRVFYQPIPNLLNDAVGFNRTLSDLTGGGFKKKPAENSAGTPSVVACFRRSHILHVRDRFLPQTDVEFKAFTCWEKPNSIEIAADKCCEAYYSDGFPTNSACQE